MDAGREQAMDRSSPAGGVVMELDIDKLRILHAEMGNAIQILAQCPEGAYWPHLSKLWAAMNEMSEETCILSKKNVGLDSSYEFWVSRGGMMRKAACDVFKHGDRYVATGRPDYLLDDIRHSAVASNPEAAVKELKKVLEGRP